jgi:hypothetical protein
VLVVNTAEDRTLGREGEALVVDEKYIALIPS